MGFDGWRCTIIDPRSKRDAYVRAHGSSYEVAMPTSNRLDDVIEAGNHVLVLAMRLVVGSFLTAELTPYTDKGFSQVTVTQNFRATEVMALIGVNRALADRATLDRFEKHVKTFQKPPAKKGE